VALETKLVSVFPENDARGIPSHQGLIALFDESDGTPIALMDGTYITGIRTGGAAAVATRVLARQDARVLAILGAGGARQRRGGRLRHTDAAQRRHRHRGVGR
jgi:ornithine cyclodeaminase/alanine dehydrogenase-like protein (mu-crystallin family)